MKIYIGSSFKNAKLVNYLSMKLSEKGIVNAYNWTNAEYGNETKKEMREFALLEKKAIEEADAIIFILPMGRGSHIELGMALANNKPIYFFASDKDIFEKDTVNFYELPQIKKFVVTVMK